MRTHYDLDERSLRLHRLIAEKLRREPQRFAMVQATLAHWQQVVDPRAQPYVQSWQELARQGMQACLEAAVQPTEQGQALRQASPFAGVLTHKERFAFFREWAQERQP
jgi:hypothetical protein